VVIAVARKVWARFLQSFNGPQVTALNAIQQIMAEDHRLRLIESDPRYHDPRSLVRYERSVYSQGGEDGVTDEIFRRIGVESRTCVEIGSGPGNQNNTAYFLLNGWKTWWYEGSPERVATAKRQFSRLVGEGQLTVSGGYVTSSNISSLLSAAGVPTEPDLLSLDIDGNDVHVLERLGIRPRVIVLEYNSSFPPDVRWSVADKDDRTWNNDSEHGASLRRFCDAADAAGYRLVGCSFAGLNAFFVRADLIGDHFHHPGDIDLHYEPPRFWALPPDRQFHPPSARTTVERAQPERTEAVRLTG
jgi:hypothetical protein